MLGTAVGVCRVHPTCWITEMSTCWDNNEAVEVGTMSAGLTVPMSHEITTKFWADKAYKKVLILWLFGISHTMLKAASRSLFSMHLNIFCFKFVFFDSFLFTGDTWSSGLGENSWSYEGEVLVFL